MFWNVSHVMSCDIAWGRSTRITHEYVCHKYVFFFKVTYTIFTNPLCKLNANSDKPIPLLYNLYHICISLCIIRNDKIILQSKIWYLIQNILNIVFSFFFSYQINYVLRRFYRRNAIKIMPLRYSCLLL